LHYLQLALLAEGSSDHRFLPRILHKLTIDLCSARATRPIEVADEVFDLTALRISAGTKMEDRAERTRKILLDAARSFNILFIHADGGGDPQAVRASQFEPWADWTKGQDVLQESRPVAVIPIREMEAWSLADGDALRIAFGTVLSDEELGLPVRSRDVETISDPKKALEAVHTRVIGRRRRKKERTTTFLSAIGERIRLDRLRQIPAFEVLERDLQEALQDLGYFR
jgi:hypothetical protein